MSTTQPKLHYSTSAEEQAQYAIYSTIDRLDSMPVGSDRSEAIADTLQAYDYWRENGIFGSTGGVMMEKVLDEDDLSVIPTELGFDPAKEVCIIHFTPPYFSKNRLNGEIESMAMRSPMKDQKSSFMASGLRGALELITLIEAGLIKRPDYLIGETNLTMARFARKAGFKTIVNIIEERAGDSTVRVNPNSRSYKKMEDKVSRIPSNRVLRRRQQTPKEQTRKIIKHLLNKGVVIQRQLDKADPEDRHVYTAEKNSVVQLIDALITDGEVGEANLFVVGTYEDFKDHVLAVNQKLGARITKLAQRDLEVLSGSVSN